MFSKALSVATVAFAASAVVNAQTFTACDPTKKTCPADPAFGQSVNCDFTKGPCDIFTVAGGTKLDYKNNGAIFSINSEHNAPTIATGKYIFFGKVEVEVQAAPGAGIITSTVLQSDDLDEIDWEWVGSDNKQVQTNYFTKGDTTTYDRGAFHSVDSPTTSFHTYTVEWTSKAVTWMINGKTVRTLSSDAVKGKFPQSPMQIKLGTWCAGGKNSPEGTRIWAGGFTDFSKAPFNAFYKSISIVDYAGKDSPAKGGVKEYVYGDRSGSWESIKVVAGTSSSDGGDNKDKDKSSSAGPSAKPSGSGDAKSDSPNNKAAATGAGSDAPSSTGMKTASGTTDGAAATDAPSSTGASSTGKPTSTGVVSGASSMGSVGVVGLLMAGAGVVLAQVL
ncbi:hypothetical protein E4U32_005244 [Claviceps aff. humidiphila group G2b]|uniref:Crh-like protein n=1 Tax=Claviceps arundinis TaxID=1623583 RepID=A0A9P7MYR5_9HYPO|nr:hypothetical protein E4U57_004657 [Claviceps arundinis]KAG5974604.1 hypothetical protein E4U56_004414 [Claviceps arundinis]KAG6057323.1 hypothetical protein E4U32_005244 [Claviceps aff. humidiphila group G2b]